MSEYQIFSSGFVLGLLFAYGFSVLWRSWRHLGDKSVNLPPAIIETPRATPKRKRNMYDA